MTIEIVEDRLDALLKKERAKVLLLTGGWGAGKTHQWKQALQRAATIGNRPRYAYVSLFGLSSLTEIRKRIAEETVSAIKLPGKAGTVGEVIEEGGWRFKPLQLIKLLPVIPYLGKLESLANELSFSAVRNAVVCFDDLERGGATLRLADVFGLASYLKEERNCRVVLISNEEKLNPESKDELSRYLEKVVDENVHFAPTPNEACKIALGEKPDLARLLLHEQICKLEISNIRVISRLSNMTAELASMLEGFHERVLKEAIHTLALFGAAHFLPTDGFPSVEHLMKLGGDDWSRYFRGNKKAGDETKEDHKLAAWDARLTRYGYSDTSPFDVEIGRSVQRGYFDYSKLEPLAKELSVSSATQAARQKFHDAWSKFWNSLNGNNIELLKDLHEITIGAIDVIGPEELQNVFEVFQQAGQQDAATDLLDRFIASNQSNPAMFAYFDVEQRGQNTGTVADRFRAEIKKLMVQPSIEDALDRIDIERGWSPEDIRVVSEADTNEIERLLRNSEGGQFRVRLKTLLRIGTLQDAKENEKRVSEQTLAFLKKIAHDDPIVAIRMRRFIPSDDT